MSARKISLTSDALNELFRYDPESGKLFWEARRKGRRIGKEAGSPQSTGYRQVMINGRQYKAHRLIWLMTYGEIREDMEIDHINGVRDDNKLENLRLVTTQYNQWNHTRAKGYYRNKSGKWQAQIRVDGRTSCLGIFTEEKDARNAYLQAKEIYHRVGS